MASFEELNEIMDEDSNRTERDSMNVKKRDYDKKKDRKGFIVAGVMVAAIGAVALFAVDRDDGSDDTSSAPSDDNHVTVETERDSSESSVSDGVAWSFAEEASCDFGTGLVGGSDDAEGYWDWLQTLSESSQSQVDQAVSSCDLSASSNDDDAVLVVSGTRTQAKMSDIDSSGDHYVTGGELPLPGWYYGVLGGTGKASSYTYTTTSAELMDVFNDRWS